MNTEGRASALRRIIRTKRLLAELGLDDPLQALEELVRIRARDGSPKGRDEDSAPQAQQPGPKDAPNNRSPEAAPTGEALTDEQIERHTLLASQCPPDSRVLLVSSVRRLRAALSAHPSAPVAPSTTEREVLAEAYAALYGNSTLVTTNTVTAQAYMRAPEFEWLCIRFNTWEHAHRAHKALHKLEEVATHPPAVQPVAPAGRWSVSLDGEQLQRTASHLPADRREAMTRDAEPENWQARLGAVVRQLDEAIETGRKEPALRAIEIANQLIAEAVILEANAPPDDVAAKATRSQP